MSAFVVSNDRSDGTPNVPDANANGKWRTKLWRRNREAGHGTGTSIYVWDDALSTSDPTLLKWRPVGTFIGESTLSSLQSGSTRLSITPSGGNVYFDVVESNLVLGNISGNLPGSKLPSNVALTDAANTFTLHTQFPSGLTGTLTGNADTATTWAASRTVTLTGDATGSASGLDGSADLTINTTVTHQAVGSASPYWNASHFMSRVLTNDVPTDGQAYAYEASTGKWKPGFPVVSLTGRTTDELIEGSTNHYYTAARFDTRLGTKDTDDLSEGATNLYFTDSRARSSLTSSSNTNGTVLQSYDNSNGTFATVDLDNRYLQSFTETDPTVPSHVKSITSTNISNWNTAHGWGDHGQAGYLTSFTETDPTVPAHVKSITATEKSNWNTAYGWGNHSGLYHAAGGSSTTDFVVRDLTVHGTTLTKDTQQVNIGDNIMVLNAEEAGTPTDNAGIEVERGTSTNTSLRWNESTDRWQFTNDGTNYKNLAVDTDDLAEGSSNLYYTDSRFDTRLGTKDTDDLSEGSTNLYHTSTRVDARISAASIGDLSDVSLSGLSNGQVLEYNSTSGNFEPATVSSGGGGGSGTVNSGTSGKLAYYSSTGTTLDDAAELHFDTPCLGIGTASPTAFLQIEATNVLSRHMLHIKGGGASGSYAAILVEAANGTDLFKVDTLSYETTFPSGYNVGFGTTSPSFLVHANETDTTSAQVDVIAASCGGSTVATLGYTTSGGAYDSAMVRAANNKDLVFVTNNLGLERMRITDSGNVKIGDAVTDFTSKLTVSGNGSTDTGLFMYDGAAGTYLAIETGAANGVVNLKADARSGAYPPLTFETGGSESARIDSSGNLGLGTSSPGSVWWTSTKNLHISDATAAGLFLTNTTNALEFNLACDSGGGVYFDVHDSTDGNDNFFAFRTEDTGGANTPTERLRINKDGKVGLGSSSPSSYYGNANDLVVARNDHAGITIKTGTSDTGWLVFADGTASGDNTRGGISYDHNNDLMAFRVDNDRKAVIDSGGSLGINTNSPNIGSWGRTLTVNSDSTASSCSLELAQGGTLYGFVGVQGSGSSNALDIAAYQSQDIRFRVGASGGTHAMVIDSSGNVKVGNGSTITASTNADDLVIDKGAADTGLSILSTTTGRIYFGDATHTDAGSIRYVHADDSMRFETDSTEQMRILADGSVGINTTAPNEKLVVSGNCSVTGALQITSNTSAPSAGAALYRPASNELGFVTTSTERMRIDSSGRLGLGTASASSRLHVYAGSSGATPQSWEGITLEDDDYCRINILTPDDKAGYLIFGSASDNDHSYIAGYYDSGSPNLRFVTNGSEHMRIESDGTLNLKSEKLTLDGVSGSSGQVLTTDGSGGVSWTTDSSGSGTVTSVGITGTDGIDVDSGSPVTSSGTITLGLSNIPDSSISSAATWNSKAPGTHYHDAYYIQHTSNSTQTEAAAIPTGTTAERPSSPDPGNFRWNTTNSEFEGYDGSAWGAVGGGYTTGNGLYEHAHTISSNYTITTNNNAISAGPVSVASGVSVTVPSGSTWVVA